jgi:hypothetical protein
VLVDRFNHQIATTFDETREFLQAHFYYSPRTDTLFWQANMELALTDGILEKVAMYKAGVPVNPPLTAVSSKSRQAQVDQVRRSECGVVTGLLTGQREQPCGQRLS